MLADRCFDDYRVGDIVTTRGRTITETDVVNFAGLTWDFYPLHTDDQYARATRFGRRIAHGPLVYAFSVGLMPIDFFGDAIVAFLGVDELRHLAPVHIGDTVHVVAEVVDVSAGKSGGGLVSVRYSTRNQADDEVMTATMRFLMRAGQSPNVEQERSE